jgi:hypothetical protein
MITEYIIFIILLFVILAIFFTLNIFAKAYFYNGLLNIMKNSSGNYNAVKIIMMVTSVFALYFLLYFLFIRKPITRQSLYRRKDDSD